MINTLNIKEQQLVDGFYKTGSGPKNILVMGSCRVVNYVTYLKEWNEANGNPFTVYSIDPFSWNWNMKGERTNYEEEILNQQSNEKLLTMLKSVHIFIHEYYQNAGMFNCDKSAVKNIYRFGMEPCTDICIPNFNDLFILFNDIVDFDVSLKKKVNQDLNSFGKISYDVQKEIYHKSQSEIIKFYEICYKSDLPEMARWFEDNFKKTRLWCTCNHVTKEFTLAIFDLINEKFLHLDLSKWFNRDHEDLFANNCTQLTPYDLEWYGYLWK